MFGKVFKFIIFYFILSNNLSIYYLLLGNMFSRLLFLLTLAKHKKFFSLNIALKIIKADVVKNNFLNFKYNIVAFLDNKGGVSNFTFTLPDTNNTTRTGEKDVKVVCEDYNTTYVNDSHYSLTATFRRVYEAWAK